MFYANMADSKPPLRQAQRQYTVELIIDAFSELTVNKPHFRMVDLADAAGVSIRTLYRYYPNRDALQAGLDERIATSVGQLPTTGEELVQGGETFTVRRSFGVFGENDKLIRALVMSRLTGASTDTGHTERTEAIRKSIDRSLADKPEVIRRQVLGLVRLLSGALAWMTLTDDEIGLTSDEAGAAVDWALRRLFSEPPEDAEFLE